MIRFFSVPIAALLSAVASNVAHAQPARVLGLSPRVDTLCNTPTGGPVNPATTAFAAFRKDVCGVLAAGGYLETEFFEGSSCNGPGLAAGENCLNYRMLLAFNRLQVNAGAPVVFYLCESDSVGSVGIVPNSGHRCFDPDRNVASSGSGPGISASSGLISVNTSRFCINAEAVFAGGNSPRVENKCIDLNFRNGRIEFESDDVGAVLQ
jgi:hypothetical protein